ncbi:hypothetical protein FQN57_007009 [Myotisia sp. PD_48]|nr:hypothetical protein FQN57_007009 [Myotisia sp. PD_48]
MNGTYHTSQQPNHYASDAYNAPHAASLATPYNQPANPPAHPPPPPSNDSKADIPKDEVGWFFVEQYYTTLSRSPEKLHLFYSRKSQFISGVEAEKVNIALGQKAINERIKELDYHDCKVRVLNVDSQASFENIVVVVIGEISNKSEPPRKFVQTFVLAEQQNGYYVLNDIFRYLNDDDEEAVADEGSAAPVEEPAVEDAPAEVAQPAQETLTERQVDNEAAVQETDQLLEKEVAAETAALENQPEESTKEVAAEVNPAPVPVVAVSADAIQAERPKEPESTPAAPTPKAPSPAPEKEPVVVKETAPAKPMSWASIASVRGAAPAVATPVLVSPNVSLPQTPAAPQPTATPPQAQQPTAEAAATPESDSGNAAGQQSSEWQTAENSRRQARPQAPAAGEEKTLAYIKNVNEKVDARLLRETLAGFGKLKYFDVNRPRSCAFAEFVEIAGFKAAVAANPHQIGSERVVVEERRPRPNTYGGSGSYTNPHGGANRGRGDRTGGQNRGGFQKDSGRYTPRGGRGGGNVTPKGRQPQAA